MTSPPTPELLVRVDRRRGRIVPSIQAELRRAIHDGRLLPGDALPATRTLAEQLGVSRASVVEAYARLGAEGYLESRPGSATRVAVDDATIGAPLREVVVPDDARYDLRPGGPDVELFSWSAWMRAAARVARRAPGEVLQYADPSGSPRLRIQLASYLGRTRAVVAEPEAIVVTSGVTQALVLLCRALARRGMRTLAVEDPGPNPIERGAIQHAGLEPVPVPVDDDGLDVAALEASGADAVLVTPAHQYPTGSVLAPQRRRALLRWARGRDRVIIEDDYDAEFRYDREAVAALQGLAPGRVAYLGSASKLLAPGLRTGWAIVPDWLRQAFATEKAFDDYGSAVIEQEVLAELIADGSLGRHVRRARLSYRRRRDAALRAVEQHFPGWRIRGVAAGLQLLVTPPAPIDDRAIARRAWQSGIRVGALSTFRDPGGSPMPDGTGLVIGFAMVREPAIEASIAALASVVAGDSERASA